MGIESDNSDAIDLVFYALSDPTRRAILLRLASGEASVSELMEPFKLRQPTISKHLKVLEAAGLIEQGQDKQKRPRRLAPHGLKAVANWLEPFHQQWEKRLNNLGDHLVNQKKKDTSNAD